jgi:hypothetical protein
MADMKFSCPQCGQHIGYSEAWAGFQIECPACHSSIIVPQIQRQPAAPQASVPVKEKESPQPAGAKLASGVTQVARSTAHAPAATKRAGPHPPSGDNSLLKYGVMAVAIVALAGVGYFYGLPLLNNALQQEPASNTSAGAKSSQSGGTIGGPMGDVSGAMDVSETLDTGSSSSTKARPVASTNNAARPRPDKPAH